MNDNRRKFTLYGKSPYYQLFISLIIILFAGVLLFYLLLWLYALFTGVSWSTLIQNISGDSVEKNIVLLRLLMILQDVAIFIIPGIIILNLMRDRTSESSILLKFPPFNEIVIVIILGFCIIPVTSFTGQINSAMHLPDWLSGVEDWMKNKEDQADNIIGLVIGSGSFGVMMLNLLIIAILPAIGEELIFRGVFQKIFYNLLKSGHLSVFVTAFLFSTLHFQFYGFIPRFILGLVFGYLFFWSGTLWLPVISHFINNAMPVIMAYIQGVEKLTAPPDVTSWKQAMFLPLPVTISFVILFYFRNKSKNSANDGTNPGNFS